MKAVLLCGFSAISLGLAQISPGNTSDDLLPIIPSPAIPAVLPVSTPQQLGVDWGSLFTQSFGFLVIEQGFRFETEDGARHAHMPFVKGYVNSVTNLHGWADGDPFYVNYVGHPMQGSVSGFIWIQNDRKYNTAEFGKNSRYWKSRLRAAAFAWAYSEQFEIGPFSEASIGATQAIFPQQGFVDHIVTPTIGLAWIIAEDVMDKYVILPMERRGINPVYRALLRGGLNPSRSLANTLAGHLPWYRITRGDVIDGIPYRVGTADFLYTKAHPETPKESPTIAPFELGMTTLVQQGSFNTGPCIGGGATALIRVSSQWQIALDVGGCKMNGLTANFSGDSLHYMIGPRWTPSTNSRWTPYAEVLFGGQKLTEEQMFPAEKAAVEDALKAEGKQLDFPDHALYTRDYETSGWAVKAGAGLNVRLNAALALRVAGVDYMHAWVSSLEGTNYQNGMQFTSGLILRMGTW